MLFNELFEDDREPYQKAIDRLEVHHINDLNAKMDELIQRAKQDPKNKDSYRREYAKLKAQRDSLYGIKDGTPEYTVECDEEGNASVIDRIGRAIAQFTAQKYGSTAFDAATAYAGTTFKKANIDDIAGWENAAAKKRGPVRLKPVVRQQPEVVVAEWRNSAPGAEEQTKLRKVGIVRKDDKDTKDSKKEKVSEAEYKPVTKPIPQPKKLNPGWALDPTTKAELKRRKDVRNRVGVDEAGSPAQQAAIAIAMKKAGKKPKHVDEGNPNKDPWYVFAKQNPMNYKLFKTWEGAKAYADKHGLTCASSAYFHDKIKPQVNEANRDDESIIRSVMSRVFVDGGGGNISYMIEKNAPLFQHLREKFQDDLDALLSQTSPKELSQAANELRALFGRIREGWSDAIVARRTGRPRTPYSVYINGKKWKDFENDDHAENVANKLRAKFKADGRDPSVITTAPTDYDKGISEVKTRLDPKCWKGKHKEGTKMKGGVRVNNCVPNESVEEEAKHGLYYNVNKRKKAGISRDKDDPRAPTAQAWKDAAKTAKKEDINVDEEWSQKYKDSINCSNPKGFSQKAHCASKKKHNEGMETDMDELQRIVELSGAGPTEQEKEFDLIESIIEDLAERNCVDSEVIWEDLESLTDDELYVFATTVPVMEDWQKANKKDRTDGMSRKAVKAYRREHPGSKLQTAVTTKPSKLKKGSKASKRRKSYCSRSRGQMKMHNISCQKTPDKAICKARRRWNCE